MIETNPPHALKYIDYSIASISAFNLTYIRGINSKLSNQGRDGKFIRLHTICTNSGNYVTPTDMDVPTLCVTVEYKKEEYHSYTSRYRAVEGELTKLGYSKILSVVNPNSDNTIKFWFKDGSNDFTRDTANIVDGTTVCGCCGTRAFTSILSASNFLSHPSACKYDSSFSMVYLINSPLSLEEFSKTFNTLIIAKYYNIIGKFGNFVVMIRSDSDVKHTQSEIREDIFRRFATRFKVETFSAYERIPTNILNQTYKAYNIRKCYIVEDEFMGGYIISPRDVGTPYRVNYDLPYYSGHIPNPESLDI